MFWQKVADPWIEQPEIKKTMVTLNGGDNHDSLHWLGTYWNYVGELDDYQLEHKYQD